MSMIFSGPMTRVPPRLSAFFSRFDVVDRDVEGDMTLVAVGAAGDATADGGSFRRGVVLAVDHPVLHRIVRVDLPAEELGVVLLQLLAVLTDHLEVHDRLSHELLLPSLATLSA
jgi:hypothetical protein